MSEEQDRTALRALLEEAVCPHCGDADMPDPDCCWCADRASALDKLWAEPRTEETASAAARAPAAQMTIVSDGGWATGPNGERIPATCYSHPASAETARPVAQITVSRPDFEYAIELLEHAQVASDDDDFIGSTVHLLTRLRERLA